MSVYHQKIIRYYDICQVDYEVVWHLKSHLAMHYGYFDQSTRNLRSALHRMNVALAEFGGIHPGSRILDAGCGVGGSSLFLAKNFNAQVTGISLSERQILQCRKNAEAHEVGNQCNFVVADYEHTPFPDASFDVVWGIESVCYSIDKLNFLKEAYRVLKPGGQIVIADFYENDYPEVEMDNQLMSQWTSTWAIAKYAGIQEFSNKIQHAGFHTMQSKDVTRNVLRSIKRLYHASMIGLPLTYLFEFLGYRTKENTANTWSTYYQYKAWKKNLWKYMFFTAVKN